MSFIIRFTKELKKDGIIYFKNMIMKRKNYKEVEPFIKSGAAFLEHGKKPNNNNNKKNN